MITLVALAFIFLDYAFSKVPSKHMDWCMDNHTGGICFVFDSFFNVSSNSLSERINSCTGYIYIIVAKCAFTSESLN